MGNRTEMPVVTDGLPGRLVVDEAADPQALLLLGHGAGGGIEAFDLEALAAALPDRGITVARFEQPWRTAGRKVAGPAKGLDAAWRAALELTMARWPGLPLVVGGRSAGARVACRCFYVPGQRCGCARLPTASSRPARRKSRAEELAAVDAPVLVVQGEHDPFGGPDEVRQAVPGVEVVVIPGAVHALGPTRKADDPAVRARSITVPVARFVLALASGEAG